MKKIFLSCICLLGFSITQAHADACKAFICMAGYSGDGNVLPGSEAECEMEKMQYYMHHQNHLASTCGPHVPPNLFCSPMVWWDTTTTFMLRQQYLSSCMGVMSQPANVIWLQRIQAMHGMKPNFCMVGFGGDAEAPDGD